MRAPFTLSQFCPGGISRPGKPALLPGIAKELLPAGAGDQFPGAPPMAERVCGHLLPSHSSAPEESHAPANPPASWERQRIAPRRGAALKCGRNLRFPHKRPLPNRGAGVCDWLSLCGRVFHRGIIPLLTLFFSASGSQKTAVTPLRGRAADAIRPAAPPAGGSVPWRPLAVMRECKTPFPPHSFTCRA